MAVDYGLALRGRTLKEEPQPKPADASTISNPASGSPHQVTMTAVEYKIDPFALNREREDPPFEFRGGAGNGRVIDRQGNVLLESGEEIEIFGAVVSPDKKKVLVPLNCCEEHKVAQTKFYTFDLLTERLF